MAFIAKKVDLLANFDLNAKLDSFTQFSGLTSAVMKKVVDECGQSPEKLRALINLCFVPEFRPQFCKDASQQRVQIQDVELFSSSEAGSTQLPFRMFNVNSGNLIDFPAIGTLGQYAMLSHRWKGDEINLGDITDAKKKDAERLAKALEDGCDNREEIILKHSKKSDVDRVLEQAALDVRHEAKILKSLLIHYNRNWDVEECLKRSFRSKNAQQDLHWAQSGYEEAISKLRFAEVERRVVTDLLKGTTNTSIQPDIDPEAPLSPSQGASPMNKPVQEAKDRVESAKAKVEEATEEEKNARGDIDFFSQNTQVHEQVNKLIASLQKWKSSIKIEESIKQAKDIFQKYLFRQRDNCYLWLDTCCIDKKNSGELSESLALMGDWYEKAEFTLVQLEDKVSDSDAIHDWSEFSRLESTSEGDAQVFKADSKKKKLIESFKDIEAKQPEWAERGWTMQELVMSKTTFYVNEEWKPLRRPVESLGIFYYLIPYIKLFVEAGSNKAGSNKADGNKSDNSEAHGIEADNRDALEVSYPLSDLDKALADCEADTPWMKLLNAKPDERPDLQEMRNAHILINVLDRLGVDFPREMDEESATSRILEAIFMAASRIAEEPNSSEAKLIALLPDRDPEKIIGILLRQLVEETHGLIEKDREYVASFGQVTDLKDWTKGTRQSQFSTEQVMALSSKRKITKITDHVYALMGVLGVRFPTFPAEGYPKALSRLLDEVVIAHNDVSIFNWSGVDMGSTIRGRSLYPSHHKAYSLDGRSGARPSLILSETVQKKMDVKIETYTTICKLLRRVIELTKDEKRGELPFDWLLKIAQATSSLPFESLKTQTDNMGRLVEYISRTSVPSQESAQKIEKQPTSSIPQGVRLPKSVFPTTFSNPMKPRKKPDSPSPSKAPTLVNDAKDLASTAEVEMDKHNPEWVDAYLDAMIEAAPKGSPIADNAFNPPRSVREIKLEPDTTVHSGPDAKPGHDWASTKLISPNPIIVNTAGIEGVFDIQRVIITMLQPERLRRQIALSVSPRQKISGWCLISTGFAKVVVNFLCESQILEKELDAIEGITEKVLRENNRRDGKTRVGTFQVDTTDSKSEAAKKVRVGKTDKKDDKQGSDEVKAENGPGSDQIEAKNGQESNEDSKNDTPSPSQTQDEAGTQVADEFTEDEKMVSRMITFIQETDLDLVAGEWVLARFSGVPGAKWFLCHLELGTPHHYYGHRIATSGIDFQNAAPETGMVNVWETYMNLKKNRLCDILECYLKARHRAKQKAGTVSQLSQLRKNAVTGTFSLGHAEDKISPKHDKASEPDEEVSNDEDEEDNGAPGKVKKLVDDILTQGKAAIEATSDSLIHSFMEKLHRVGAERMERDLSKAALRKTPKILHAAVENLSDNRDFLPSMCHWGQKVHMF